LGGLWRSLSRGARKEPLPVGSSLAGWGDVPVQGLSGDPEFCAQLAYFGGGLAHGCGSEPKLGWGHLVWPAARAASRPRGAQPGDGPLGDELAFEFSQSREDPEDELASRRGGVNCRALSGSDFQADAAGGEVVDGVDEVVQVAPEPVELQTTSVSPSRRALRQAVRPGRSSRRPEAWSS
jgi:hypothetical protein